MRTPAAKRFLGEGFHTYNGRDHAEIVALKQAGDARGANRLRHARTLHAHRPHRALCGRADRRRGRGGWSWLPKIHTRWSMARGSPGCARPALQSRSAWWVENRHRSLNEGFARHIRFGLPFVTLKAGLSLDGRIACPAPRPVPRHSRPPRPAGLPDRRGVAPGRASDAARLRRHPYRDRHRAPRQSDADRSQRSIPPAAAASCRARHGTADSAGFAAGRERQRYAPPDLLLCTTSQDEARLAGLREAGVLVEQMPRSAIPGAGVDLHAALELLGQRYQVQSVLIEGGSRLNRVALESGCVDRLTLSTRRS